MLTIQVFDAEDEAIALANDSEYGLSASVWSRDIDRPLRVARELDSGTVWINNWAVLFDQFEEGGFKQSGQGRMRGLAVIDDFIEYKHISLTPGEVQDKSAQQFEKENSMSSQTKVECIQALLNDPLNVDLVNNLIAKDATYVSLNFDNPRAQEDHALDGYR